MNNHSPSSLKPVLLALACSTVRPPFCIFAMSQQKPCAPQESTAQASKFLTEGYRCWISGIPTFIELNLDLVFQLVPTLNLATVTFLTGF